MTDKSSADVVTLGETMALIQSSRPRTSAARARPEPRDGRVGVQLRHRAAAPRNPRYLGRPSRGRQSRRLHPARAGRRTHRCRGRGRSRCADRPDDQGAAHGGNPEGLVLPHFERGVATVPRRPAGGEDPERASSARHRYHACAVRIRGGGNRSGDRDRQGRRHDRVVRRELPVGALGS